MQQFNFTTAKAKSERSELAIDTRKCAAAIFIIGLLFSLHLMTYRSALSLVGLVSTSKKGVVAIRIAPTQMFHLCETVAGDSYSTSPNPK